ncbi:MAG: 50S ribosomal protein L30 [Nocardioidaceae bacterium]|jgi:large subunit ribosomal protein L30
MADAVRIRQVRSSNGSSRRQRATLRSLGLGRIGKSCERSDSEALRGQLAAVGHLVEVERG